MSNENKSFTKEKLKAFKKAYETAKMKAQATFIFEGDEYIVNYAKYLIEYLEDKFKNI
jgi:hypothetical protein